MSNLHLSKARVLLPLAGIYNSQLRKLERGVETWRVAAGAEAAVFVPIAEPNEQTALSDMHRHALQPGDIEQSRISSRASPGLSGIINVSSMMTM